MNQGLSRLICARRHCKNKRWIHQSVPNLESPRYNYNPDHFSIQEPTELQHIIKQFTTNHSKDNPPALQLYDAKQLASFHQPARPSISLSRDFIHDSLYNPHYGYFFNQVEILDTSHPSFPIPDAPSSTYGHSIPNYLDHQQKLALVPIDQRPPDSSLGSIQVDPNHDQRQIWHTPSELFKPWYAWSIASVIVKNHLAEGLDSKNLNIYEIGAGNGSLCCGILDYIEKNHPKLYPRTNYVTIELSTRLAKRQRDKITEAGHSNRATVINQSILSLSDDTPSSASLITPTLEPCWILGMEVLDNLSRDVIRRDPISLQPFQSIVITDLNGDFHERFIPITKSNNPNLSTYLSLMDSNRTASSFASKFDYGNKINKFLTKWRLKYLPFQSNLSQYEFIPTNYLVLIQNLFKFFPNHKLILSDFFHLNNSVIKVNNPYLPNSTWWSKKKKTNRGAPVVQTRYNGTTIPVSTFLVKPGLFDIFFPTDFDELIQIYQTVSNQYRGKANTRMCEKKSSITFEKSDHDDGGDTYKYMDGSQEKVNKEIQLMDQNQFLIEYLSSQDFRKTLNHFNNNLVNDQDQRKVNIDQDIHQKFMSSIQPTLKQDQKLRDFSLDSDLVFNYYQNVKLLIIN